MEFYKGITGKLYVYNIIHLFCLFDLILYVPVNNLSVTSEQVFLSWTSTKLWLGYNSLITQSIPMDPKQHYKGNALYILVFEPVHEISNNVVCATSKPQISLHIRAVWSEPLLVAWVFIDCWATDWTPFGVSNLKRRLQRIVRVNTCQNVKLLEISCRSSFFLKNNRSLTNLKIHVSTKIMFKAIECHIFSQLLHVVT